MLVDECTVTLLGGRGGRGSVTFRKEKFVPFGGPDGGDGGTGGAVFLKATEDVRSLGHLVQTPRLRAENGGDGRRANKIGRAGDDLEVLVPVGTVALLKDLDGEKTLDMDSHGKRELVCDGGLGGRGNRAFATAVMKVPRMAEVGDDGETREVSLIYKMPCDVAIIGEANVGKSSLLNRWTGAGTRVAEYPMTTFDPVVGVTEWNWKQYRVVEVPATWTGSSDKAGAALKHAHRASAVVIVLDASQEDLYEQYIRVSEALVARDPRVAEKPRMVVINKVDAQSCRSSSKLYDELEGLYSIIDACSLPGVGAPITSLNEFVAMHVTERESEDGLQDPVPVLRPAPMGRRISVKKDSDAYVVHAGALERLVRGTDISDWEARMQLMSLLEKAGMHQALQRAGVQEGDTVRIGGVEMEWT